MDEHEVTLLELSVRQAADRATDGSLDPGLAELGWSDALEADAPVAVRTLFEVQGERSVTSSALDAVLAQALGVDGAVERPALGEHDTTVRPALGGDGRVVLPALGSETPPGRDTTGGLVVDGLGPATLAAARRAAVATADGVAIVATDELTLEPVAGIDPSFGLVRVRADGIAAEVTPTPGAWDDAVAAGRRALGHELVGTSRAMLRLARDHAVERIQFGVPIASFQAVRHKLAEAHVAIEAPAAALDGAWLDPGPASAAAAKAIAGRSARTVARHGQQVLAGIGFTAEHPFHHHLRRALVLDALLGDARTLTASVGADLLRSRAVPSPLPL